MNSHTFISVFLYTVIAGCLLAFGVFGIVLWHEIVAYAGTLG